MTTNNTLNTGNAQRKQLSSQIDRLDGILDGLAEALNSSVEMAVRDVVGQVVRETVDSTIREVLGNPDLLRAALAQHSFTQPVPQPQPMHTPKHRTLKELLTSAGSWVVEKVKQTAATVKTKLSSAAVVVGEKVKQAARTMKTKLGSAGATLCATIKQAASKVKSKFGSAWTWSLNKVQQGLARVSQNCKRIAGIGISVTKAISVAASYAWKFRKTCTIALGVGVAAGLANYVAGPVIASVASGIGGAALTVSGMILLPLWRLMLGSRDSI